MDTTTHPETAWLIRAVPAALAVAALLLAVLLLRGRLALALAMIQSRRARRRRAALPLSLRPDPALIWAPESIAPARLLLICAGAAAGLVAGMGFIAPIFLALALAAPLTIGLAWLLLAGAERAYADRLDRELTPAVGRLSALLRGGSGFRVAIERLVADMPDGPLRGEWRYLLERQGVPLDQGGIATPEQVTAALAAQTPSARHATLLNHLSAAVGQPQDVLVRRCAAAYAALQSSDRRREEAITELAQMRYSGFAVGLAGLVMAAYLLWTQWERVQIAYSGPLGIVVAPIVVGALLLPVIGGELLARAEDVDY